MKKIYKKPIIDIERFSANEFIATCGYEFECDAGRGRPGRLWEDVNKNGHLDEGDVCITPGPLYQSCGELHIVPASSKLFQGFFSTSKESVDPLIAAETGKRQLVFIWEDNSELNDKKFHGSSWFDPNYDTVTGKS